MKRETQNHTPGSIGKDRTKLELVEKLYELRKAFFVKGNRKSLIAAFDGSRSLAEKACGEMGIDPLSIIEKVSEKAAL